MRSFSLRMAAATTPVAVKGKMQTLHKLLTGDTNFKNKALLRESNVELVFGSSWKGELNSYSAGLPTDERKILTRQVQRLSLTRYTTRELAQFAGNGVESIDAAAHTYMVAEGVKMLQVHGEAELVKYVEAEAVNAQWSVESTKKLIQSVKSAAKK